jgi:hypothetical protein
MAVLIVHTLSLNIFLVLRRTLNYACPCFTKAELDVRGTKLSTNLQIDEDLLQ